MNINENNTLKEEIGEILRLCNKAVEEHGEKASFFGESISEQEMHNWEEQNKVNIPKSYKEWLRFTGNCRIVSNTARFWGPKEFHSNNVSEDLIVIGELIGDGELICFSKTTGEFQSVYGYDDRKCDSFKKILIDIIDLLDDEKPMFSSERIDEIKEQLVQLRKMKEELKMTDCEYSEFLSKKLRGN